MSQTPLTVPSSVDVGRAGDLYQFKFDGIKADKNLFVNLSLVIEDEFDRVDREVSLSFVANPRNCNNSLRDYVSNYKSTQTSIETEGDIAGRMLEVHSTYADYQKEQPTIDVSGIISGYAVGNTTKVSVRIPVKDAIVLLSRPNFVLGGSAVVIRSSVEE